MGLTLVPVAQAMSTYVPGAHSVVVTRYTDLTTNNPAIGSVSEARRAALAQNDYSGDGKPKRMAWYTPDVAVPGLEIAGMFGDSKFVIRVPDKWNGKLVVVAAPGVGDERSTDAILSDYVLTKQDLAGNSYAYACTDKGTTGEVIPTPDGKFLPWAKPMTAMLTEQDSFEEWNVRLHELTVATKEMLKKTRGQAPTYTYLIGMSNGGYAARYAIENDAALYDGMIDWEGVLWRANEENGLSSLSAAVKSWQVIKDPKANDTDKAKAYETFTKFGLPAESRILLPFHATFYYLPTVNQFRKQLDPESFNRNWWEFLSNPQDYNDYNYFDRPAKVKEKIAKFQNTGNIKKPVISIHGTWDSLLFPGVHIKPYEALVKKNGKESLYRLYMIDHGNHFDSLAGNPQIDKNKQIQPLLPYVHQAFDAMVEWVEGGIEPAASKTIPMPQSADNAIDITTGKEIPKY
jgi:pimeloyl-ACP methyl ester carboxylesterase